MKTREVIKNGIMTESEYQALHAWARRRLSKKSVCEKCGVDNKKLELANKSHKYIKSIDDWLLLCKPCHFRYDKQEVNFMTRWSKEPRGPLPAWWVKKISDGHKGLKYKNTGVKLVCGECKNVYKDKPSRVGRSRYCSFNCYKKHGIGIK